MRQLFCEAVTVLILVYSGHIFPFFSLSLYKIVDSKPWRDNKRSKNVNLFLIILKLKRCP